MDVFVRFWDDKSGNEMTKYFDSQFLSRPSVKSLYEQLANSTQELSKNTFYSCLCMDQMRILKSLDCWMSRGTNVKYHELKMGETTLLVLHGALQTGIEKVDWQLNKFMKAI